MPDRTLEQLLVEVNGALTSDQISEADRAMLGRVREDLEAALRSPAHAPPLAAAPAGVPATARSGTSQLRETLSSAIERLESKHPNLTSLLSKTLDTLSDLGL